MPSALRISTRRAAAAAVAAAVVLAWPCPSGAQAIWDRVIGGRAAPRSAVPSAASPATTPAPAFADTTTGNPCQPYLNARGYCTNYVHDRVQPPWPIRDAKLWTGLAQQSGWIVSDQPAPGAIAVFGGVGEYGHVALVEGVSGGQFTVSEMNWGTMDPNVPRSCAVTVNFGRVTQRTLAVGSGARFLQRPGSQPASSPVGSGSYTPPAYTPPTNTPPSGYPDGTLLRARGDDGVYVIEGGARHGVPDPATFSARGYRWNRVREVSPQELASIPAGPTLPSVNGGPVAAPAPYAAPPTPAPSLTSREPVYLLPLAPWRDGALLRVRGQSTVYVVQGGVRRRIPDAPTFLANGYRWQDVVDVTPDELQRNPEGPPLASSSPGPAAESTRLPEPSTPGTTGPPVTSWPQNSLVRADRGADRDKVYVVEQGWRRWVPDAETFNARGYRWEDVHVIRPDQIALIPLGQPLPTASTPAQSPVYTPPSAPAPVYSTPTAPTAPAPAATPSWPDGTLLRAQGQQKVYVLEGGRRRWIPDEVTFRARGWRFEDVRDVPPQQLAMVPEGSPLPRSGAAASPAPSSTTTPSSSPWRDGTLVRARGNDRVYVIEAGKRRWVPDEPTFRARGYSFASVLDVDPQQLNAVPEGPPLPHAG